MRSWPASDIPAHLPEGTGGKFCHAFGKKGKLEAEIQAAVARVAELLGSPRPTR